MFEEIISWVEANTWIFGVMAIINWTIVALTWSFVFRHKREICSGVKPSGPIDEQLYNRVCRRD